MGWTLDRQEKKSAKRRAKQRKAESRKGQQQGETSIGEEAVPGVAGKVAGRWRDLRRRAEADASTRLGWDLWQVSGERRDMLVPTCSQAWTSEGPATKSGLRNPPIKTVFIGLSCGADQCGFNYPRKQDNHRLEKKFSDLGCGCLKHFLRES